jgi:hypothetical protein
MHSQLKKEEEESNNCVLKIDHESLGNQWMILIYVFLNLPFSTINLSEFLTIVTNLSIPDSETLVIESVS